MTDIPARALALGCRATTYEMQGWQLEGLGGGGGQWAAERILMEDRVGWGVGETHEGEEREGCG